MKTVFSNTKRFLALFLALAMVVLAVPDTALFAAERYSSAKSYVDENGDTQYESDENGDLIKNEDGSYSAYVEEPEDGNGQEPEDPENVVPDEPVQSAQSAPSATANTLDFTGNVLGTPVVTGADVSYSGDSHATVTVYQVINEEESPLANNGTWTIANKLVVRANFATGYEPAENSTETDVAPVTYYQIGNKKTAITLEEDAENGGYTAELELAASAFTIEEETYSDIAIVVASAPEKYADGVEFVGLGEDVEVGEVTNGVDAEAAVSNAGKLDAYYGKDVTFQLAVKESADAEITGVKYYVGADFDELTAAQKAALPSVTYNKNKGIYTIEAAEINALAGAADGTVITVYVETVAAATVTLNPALTKSQSSDAGLELYNIDLTGEDETVAAAIEKAYPTKTTYNKALTYTYKLASGYAEVVATGTKTTEDGNKAIAITSSVTTKGSGASAYRLATFTVPWSEISDATAISLTFKGVSESYDVTFADKDSNVTAASYTAAGKAEGGATYKFTLTAKDNYVFNDDNGSDLKKRITKATAATTPEALVESGIYAVDASVTNPSLAAKSQIYIIALDIASDQLTLEGTIEGSLAKSDGGVGGKLKIYLGDLTSGKEVEVELEDEGSGVNTSSDAYKVAGKANYGTDYEFQLAIKNDYKLLGVTYKVGNTGAVKDVPSTTNRTTGVTTYKIAGTEITDDITITTTTVKVEEATLKIVAADNDAKTQVTAITTAIGTNGTKTYNGGKLLTAAEAKAQDDAASTEAGKYPAVLYKNGDAPQTGESLNLSITLKDADYTITKEALNAANTDVYTVSNVVIDGKTFTITGAVIGTTGNIVIPVSETGSLSLAVTDNDPSKTVSGSLEAMIIPENATDEEIAKLPWTKITAPYTLSKRAAGDEVVFRHKALASTSKYEIVSPDLTKDDAASAENNGAYTVYNAVKIAKGSKSVSLTTKIKVTGTTTAYVYNANAATVSRLTLKTDTANVSTDALLETYLTDYLTNEKSAKVGVLKLADTKADNGYTVYPAVARPSTNKADAANLVLTFTVAANQEPVVKVINAEGEEADVTGATLKTSAGATYVKGVTVTTAAVSYVLTIPKTQVADAATISIDTEPTEVTRISVFPSTESTVEVSASVNGKAITVTTVDDDIDYYTVDANIGDKVVLTVKPADGFTVYSAENTIATTTANGTTTRTAAITSKPDTGFTTTLTVAANVYNSINVISQGNAVFGALTGGTSTTKAGTESTAINSRTKQSVTSYTYDALVAGTKYAIPKFEVGGKETSITSLTYTGTAKDSKTKIAFDKDAGTGEITIGADDANTTFKLTINGIENAYTVKAAKVLDTITVKGESNGLLKQEIGTTQTYAITANNGASLAGLAVTGTGVSLGADAKGNPVLIVNTVSKDDKEVKLKVGEVEMKTFKVRATNSKLAGTTPTVSLKSASAIDLTLNLALPSAVSSTTLKNLIANTTNLVYAVTISDGETTDVQYFRATDAKQVVTLDLSKFESDQDGGWKVGAKDFTVDTQVFLISAADDANEQAIATAIGDDGADALAKSDPTGEKTFSTKDLKYPTSLRISAAGNKLYAGQDYSALAATSKDKNYYARDGKPVAYAIANVTPDAASTVPDLSNAYNVEASEDSDDIIAALATKAFVYDGKLLVELDNLNKILTNTLLESTTASGELVVIAPYESEDSELVSAKIKVTVEQRAAKATVKVSGEDAQEQNTVAAPATQTLAKKNGAAVTATLGIQYQTVVTDDGIVGETKANLNQFTYALGTVDGITADDITIANGKATVKAGYVLPNGGEAKFTVEATSAYNPNFKLTYTVNLTQAESAQAQGEAVLVTTLTDGGATKLVAKTGDKTLTVKDLETILAAGDLKVVILKPNAVIPTTRVIDEKYIVDDTNVTVTSSKATILATGAPVAVYNNAVSAKTTSLIQPNKIVQQIGAVTLTAVAENTGAKKTVNLTIANGAVATTSKTEKDIFPIVVNEVASPNVDATYYADRAETITVDEQGTIFEISVLKGTVDLTASPAEWKAQPDALDDYYTQSQLKVSTGATLLTSNVRQGIYTVMITGKQGKVTVNGVTYTIANAAKADAISAGTISHTAAYAAYGLAQEIVFTTSSTKLANAKYALLSADVTTTDDKNAFAVLDEQDETVTIETDASVGGKAVFTLPLENTANIPVGRYTFYVTYLDQSGVVLTEATKATLNLTAAPAFSAKTSYTVPLKSETTASLQFTDTTGKKTAEITGVYNLYVNGRDNEFVKLFAAYDELTETEKANLKNGIVKLADNTTLLTTGAVAANRTGYIEYTTDGDVTRKLAKVTLTFTADASVTADAISAALEKVADEWSVENVTAAKALTYIKTLVNVPSDVTLSFQSFDADKNYDKTALEDGVQVTMDAVLNVAKRGETTEQLNLTFTIPSYTVALDFETTNGVQGIGYTLKDGANNNVTVPTKSTEVFSESSIAVLNGATLSITKAVAADTYKPNTYTVESTKYNVSKSSTNGAAAIGTIKEDGKVSVTAYNTITLQRAANVTDVSLYTGTVAKENLVAYTGAKNARVTANVPAGATLAITATNAQGYDVQVKESVTKTDLVTVGDGGDDVTAKTFTVDGGTDDAYVLADIHAARTFAATASAAIYEVEVVVSNADGVVNTNSLQVRKGSTWGTPSDLYGDSYDDTKVPVVFGQTAAFRLHKDKDVDTTKAGNYWTLTAKHGATALKDTAPSTQYATYTTAKLTADNTEEKITFVGQQNSSVTVTYDDKNRDSAISAMKLVAYTAYGEDEQAIKSTTALTSGKAVIVPEPEDSVTYVVEYKVKDGFDDYVAADEDTAEKSTTSGVIDVSNELKTGAKLTYTLTTKKATAIGLVDTSSLYGDEAVDAIFDATTITYTWNNGKIGDTFGLSATEGTAMDASTYKQRITFQIVTKDGYDLSLQTYKPGVAKPTVSKMTQVGKADSDGKKTWTATVTISGDVAGIGFLPVPQTRTITLTDKVAPADVTAVTYTLQGATKATNGTLARKSGTTVTPGVTTIKAPFNSTVTINFVTAKGVLETGVELKKVGATQAETGTAKGAVTTGYTYTYEVKAKSTSAVTDAYVIQEVVAD